MCGYEAIGKEVLKDHNYSQKRLLIIYQGGGYDGCIWETNFCLIVEKHFRNIFASGSMGAKTEKEFLNRLGELHEENKRSLSNDLIYEIYDIDDPESLKKLSEFLDRTDAFKHIAQKLRDWCSVYIKGKCNICGEEIDIVDAVLTDPDSFGGIVIAPTSITCEDCYSAHTCSYCGEFCEDSSELDEEYYCERCQTRNSTDYIDDLADLTMSSYWSDATSSFKIKDDKEHFEILAEIFDPNKPEHIEILDGCLRLIQEGLKKYWLCKAVFDTIIEDLATDSDILQYIANQLNLKQLSFIEDYTSKADLKPLYQKVYNARPASLSNIT